MKRILIVKTSSLGDIIHAFPVATYLKHKFPNVIIDWVVEENFSDLIHGHPDVDNAIIIKTKQWRKNIWQWGIFKELKVFFSQLRKYRYDCIFDFQSNVKSGFITWIAKSKNKVGFGRKTVHEWPNLLFTRWKYDPPAGKNIREDILFLAQSFFQDFTIPPQRKFLLSITSIQQKMLQTILDPLVKKKIVMVCPGSAWQNKQVTEEALTDFLRHLYDLEQCHFLFVWGSQLERELVQRLHKSFPNCSQILDKLALPALQNLMSHMHLVVAMDSLPLHLAGLSFTKTFSIFGSSSAKKFAPMGSQSNWLQGICPYNRTFEKRCPILRTCPTGKCIRDFTGNQLFQGFLADKR